MSTGAPVGVVVRDAVPDDAEAIARVQTRGWQRGYAHIFDAAFLAALDPVPRAERLRGRLAAAAASNEPPQSTLLVAEAGDAVVGMCLFGPSRDDDARGRDVSEIYALYVDPEHWGTGAGRALMAETLRRVDHRTVTLWVLEDNGRARRFYSAAGFTADGARELFTTADQSAWEMRYRREP